MKHPVFLRGIGLASSLGAGRGAHAALGPPVVDEAGFAPHPVHRLAAIATEAGIARRELRQMEAFQRLGVHVAGLALEDAGPLDRAGTHLIVACGGGERDVALDERILAGRPEEAALHRMLMDGLRPTLFLAQLPNLLAGSISIIHGIAGSSRTMMGEDIAGAEALRIAAARVAAGSAENVLAGGALLAERPEILLLHAPGGRLHAGPWAPMGERHGLILGSGAAFLVLGRQPAAVRLAFIGTDQGDGQGQAARLAALWGNAPPACPGAISLWAGGGPGPGRMLAETLGHTVEAAFPLAMAIGALLIEDGAPQVRIGLAGQPHGEAVAVLEPS